MNQQPYPQQQQQPPPQHSRGMSTDTKLSLVVIVGLAILVAIMVFAGDDDGGDNEPALVDTTQFEPPITTFDEEEPVAEPTPIPTPTPLPVEGPEGFAAFEQGWVQIDDPGSQVQLRCFVAFAADYGFAMHCVEFLD